MRYILAGLARCAIWCVTLFWTMTYLLGISQAFTAVFVPAFITGISFANSIKIGRFYRGIHRREKGSGPPRVRGPVRRAGAAGSRCRAGHGPRCACSCPRYSGPGLSRHWPIRSYEAALAGRPDPGCGLPGGIRLRYVPAELLTPGDLGPVNLNAAVQYMRNIYGSAKPMTPQLYSGPPAQNSGGIVSGSGYTRGSQVPASAQVTSVNQPLPPGSHPASCCCVLCMPVQPSGAISGCTCPICAPTQPPPRPVVPGCTCSLCTLARHAQGASPHAPGGIVPSPPAPTASQPPSYVPAVRARPRTGGGMDGFDGAPLVAGTVLGYRWWTLRAPQLHRNPSDAGWDPGLLRGVKDFWQPGINQARCQAGLKVPHRFDEIPHDSCADGFWAYWEIQQHDMGTVSYLPVVGVVRASGQVIMGPRGFRAQKAEIVALHLPFRIEPDLPALRPSRPSQVPDYVRRAIPGSSQVMTHRRFTGRVINYGTSHVPAPFLDPPAPAVPPEPAPPTDEEIRAATDKAEAWMAVIADRLAVTYPGAEVCVTLDLMKAKYPVKSEYAPPEQQVMQVPCPYCGTLCKLDDIHSHVVNGHHF